MHPFQLLASTLGGARGFTHNVSKENKNVGASSVENRRARFRFSDSFSCHDLTSLELEEAEEYSHSELPDDYLRCTDSKGDSSNASTSDLEGRAANQWKGFVGMLKKGPQKGFQTFPHLKGVPKLIRRKSKRVREDFHPALKSPIFATSFDTDFCYFKSSWKNFSLAELKSATNNFSPENLIGEGGYAEVYKGQFKHQQYAAIKRLTRGTQEDMTADFLSELGIIVHVDHPNIAKLIGYGVEGGMHLVLQLSPHGSLASILYGPRERLDWGIRYKVAVGTAEGLVYLHEGCQRRIIHRDIKASNILLSENFEPQLSDFGLSKWLPDQWDHHVVSKIEGTFGYLPPEFFMHGIVDEKTDVYAYGVLLLELITGRQALDSSQRSLVLWAKPLLSNSNLKDLVDPCLGNAYDLEQMKRAILTASICIEQFSIQRPLMSQVVQTLKGDKRSLENFKLGQKSKLQRTYSVELFDAEEYNSTKYLNDIDKHRETLLASLNA